MAALCMECGHEVADHEAVDTGDAAHCEMCCELNIEDCYHEMYLA